MVRKQAIKRLIWQAILFVVSSAIFQTIWAGVIIIYLLRAIGLGTEIQSEETPFDGEPKERVMSLKAFAFENIFGAIFMIMLPLIPALVIGWIFPDYRWAGGVIGFIALLHLVVKPIVYDLIRIFTNNEKHIDITKKLVKIATIVVIAITLLQVLLYVIFPSLHPDFIKKENFDHKALWNEYVTEQNLGEEYKSFIGEEIDQYEKTKSKVYNKSQSRVKNGLIQEGTLTVYYEKNTDTKEWSVVNYTFDEVNTYELAKDTTWAGSNGGNNYTVTLVKGFLYNTTGHITVKSDNGETILDSDVVCTRNEDKENEYNLKTNVDLGWWNYDVRVVFNEEDGSFRFDSVYEGIISQQN